MLHERTPLFSNLTSTQTMYMYFPLTSREANFPCFYLRLFFVYSGAVSAPLVFCPDPNRDPNAEKSRGIIRVRKDIVVKFSERKGSEML